MKKKVYKSVAVRIKKDKELILEQLKKTPIVQLVCEKLGISRATFYRFKQNDETFSEAADKALREGTMLVSDMAESQLVSAIRDRNMTAIMFWLKHHHPSYKTSITVNGSILHVAEKLTPEQQKVVRDALELSALGKSYAYGQNDTRENPRENVQRQGDTPSDR